MNVWFSNATKYCKLQCFCAAAFFVGAMPTKQNNANNNILEAEMQKKTQTRTSVVESPREKKNTLRITVFAG